MGVTLSRPKAHLATCGCCLPTNATWGSCLHQEPTVLVPGPHPALSPLKGLEWLWGGRHTLTPGLLFTCSMPPPPSQVPARRELLVGWGRRKHNTIALERRSRGMAKKVPPRKETAQTQTPTSPPLRTTSGRDHRHKSRGSRPRRVGLECAGAKWMGTLGKTRRQGKGGPQAPKVPLASDPGASRS